jgi:hypothetical protein
MLAQAGGPDAIDSSTDRQLFDNLIAPRVKNGDESVVLLAKGVV